MAESWNKKEREKKKKQNKKQKEERKLERKNNPNSTSMFSYVDQDGNVTSTPPDPTKKLVINAEDIEIGVPKRAEPDPAELIRRGTVTHFNESKGYGFIRDDKSQESIFMHVNALTERVQEFNKVEYEVERGQKGLNAVNVRLVPKS